MNTTLTPESLADLREGLRRCSPETIDAAIRFRQTRELQAVPTIVYGIIQRYLPSTVDIRVANAPASTRLVEDLGLDSLTMLEIVLSVEEVLNIRIENEELKAIRTLGQLNEFIDHKITGKPPAAARHHYNRDELIACLPQQPPFLFLDEAEVQDGSVEAKYAIRGDEYFLEGHFRGEPVFPASIVFEAMGQAACLWVLDQGPKLVGRELDPKQVVFAGLDGAHFYRKAKPGDRLEFEQKLMKFRAPLAIFEGVAKIGGQPVAKIERLVLALGRAANGDNDSATETQHA